MLQWKLLNCVKNGNRSVVVICKSHYSRKASSKLNGTFKIVSKSVEDASGSKLGPSNANWELLAPHGYRFYLPGSVGPAWHDSYSASFISSSLPKNEVAELECIVQECPMLLRSGVAELFPGSHSGSSPITVVSLSQKEHGDGVDYIERLTKQFVWAAQEICGKLHSAGYWADFINPYSGVPCLSPHAAPSLYKTDQRFRSLGFQIVERGSTRIISPVAREKFVGCLFTNAPANLNLLKEILQEGGGVAGVAGDSGPGLDLD